MDPERLRAANNDPLGLSDKLYTQSYKREREETGISQKHRFIELILFFDTHGL